MNEFGIAAGLKAFLRPLDFEGRSTRTEAVALAVAYIAIFLVLRFTGALSDYLSGGGFGMRWLIYVPLILLLYPWPAMLVRRAHDVGQPAWIAIFAIVSNTSLLLIVWPGNHGENEYGPDPRLEASEA